MLTLYLLVLIFGVAQCDSCYFPPSSPLSPPKPELPNVFQTRIEINSNQKNSITRRMFYDFNKRKSAIIDQENNLETHYIFDYPTNQIHITFGRLFGSIKIIKFLNFSKHLQMKLLEPQ